MDKDHESKHSTVFGRVTSISLTAEPRTVVFGRQNSCYLQNACVMLRTCPGKDEHAELQMWERCQELYRSVGKGHGLYRSVEEGQGLYRSVEEGRGGACIGAWRRVGAGLV